MNEMIHVAHTFGITTKKKKKKTCVKRSCADNTVSLGTATFLEQAKYKNL